MIEHEEKFCPLAPGVGGKDRKLSQNKKTILNVKTKLQIQSKGVGQITQSIGAFIANDLRS